MNINSFRAASHREIELLRMPPINRMLPIHFEDGSVIKRIDVYCSACGNPIQYSQLRGAFRYERHNMIQMEAVGRCCQCKAGTGTNVRIYSDKRQIALDGQPVNKKLVRISWSPKPRLCRFFSFFNIQRNGDNHAKS